jgi:hypothetical protein
VLAVALLLVAAPAATAPVCRVAVLGVEMAAGVGDEATASALTEAVASGAREASGCQVLAPQDIRSMLQFSADRAACNASDASCIAELGQALGVQRIVASSVSRLGHAYTASLRLIDIDHAQVVAGKERVVDGDALAVRATLRELSGEVFGASSPVHTGLVVGGVAGAAVGTVVAVGAGATWLWASGTLGSSSAAGGDKATALALYNPALVGAVTGGVVALAGVAVLVAGVVIE